MKIIDLSMDIYDGMDVFEGDPHVSIQTVHGYQSHSWRLSELRMGSHTGTHVDAFSHMHEHMDSLSDIPLTRFIGEAQKVDTHGDLPDNIGLIFEDYTDIDILEKILDKQPNFVAGNISEDLERELLKHQIVSYTNLVNLNQLPYFKSFTFIGLPLKIREGDGSPVRAVAILD